MYRTTRHLFDRFVFKSHSVHRDWPVKPHHDWLYYEYERNRVTIFVTFDERLPRAVPLRCCTQDSVNIIEQWRRHPLELSQTAKTIIYSPKPGKLPVWRFQAVQNGVTEGKSQKVLSGRSGEIPSEKSRRKSDVGVTHRRRLSTTPSPQSSPHWTVTRGKHVKL